MARGDIYVINLYILQGSRPLTDTNSIALLNTVAEHVKKDMPGIVVELGSRPIIHVACGLNGSPVAPGINAEASANNLEGWLQVIAAGVVAPGQHAGGLSWHHMTAPEVHALVFGNWQLIPWVSSIQLAGLAGPVATVRYIEAIGRGRCEMSDLPQVFG